MSDHKNDKLIYTPGDIQRYLNGQMSVKEMFALESAALEDPFLADAIEGYSEKQSRGETGIAAELEELHGRIKTRTESSEEKNVIPFYKRSWLNVAVMILFITGAGILFFYFSNNSQPGKTLVAKNKLPEQKIATADSLQAAIPDRPDSASLTLNDSNKESRGHVSSRSKNKLAKKSLTQDPSPIIQTAPNPEYALSKIAHDTIRASIDSGSLAFQSSPAVTADKKLKLEKTPVVIGYGTAKKTDSFSVPLSEVLVTRMMKPTAPGINISPKDNQEASPVPGIIAYNRYIEVNKKIPTDVINIHGSVIVSFIVSGDGILSDFKIEKSLTTKLDNEAVRLIKEGPAWKTSKNKRTLASFTINF